MGIKMQMVMLILAVGVLHCVSSEEKYLFDFTSTDNADVWEEQSDTVRTVGMSKAALSIFKNISTRRAVFFALLNPQPDTSGFAGMRSLQTHNLSGYTKLQIQCRGQGSQTGFKVVLRHSELSSSNHTYEQFFQAPVDNFATVDLPFSEFKAYFRGQVVNDGEPLDTSFISSFGVQFYGGVFEEVEQKGPATLEIDWIKAVK